MTRLNHLDDCIWASTGRIMDVEEKFEKSCAVNAGEVEFNHIIEFSVCHGLVTEIGEDGCLS